MFRFLILLLISICIDSNDDYDWCPIIKPNGTYSGLRIYNRYGYATRGRKDEGVSLSHMSNRVVSFWRFDLIRNGSEGYDIKLWPNTVTPIEADKRVVYRFGFPYFNCWVERRVKNNFCFN